MSEEVLGSIELKYVQDEEERRFLFFTSYRIIVTRVETNSGKPSPNGLFDWWMHGVQQRESKAQQLKTLSAEGLLTSHKKNFEIPYSEVTEVKFEKYISKLHPDVLLLTGQRNKADDPSKLEVTRFGEIYIKTIRKKYKFDPRYKAKEHFDLYEKLIRSVLADKLIIEQFYW